MLMIVLLHFKIPSWSEFRKLYFSVPGYVGGILNLKCYTTFLLPSFADGYGALSKDRNNLCAETKGKQVHKTGTNGQESVATLVAQAGDHLHRLCLPY